MSDEQLQESATSEPQTNAREQELLNRIEALDRKNKEILEEKRKFSKVEKTLQTLPDGVDVQALIDYKNKAEQQKLEEQGNYKEAIQKSEEQFRERSAAKDKEIEELKSRVRELELISPAIQALAEVTHNPKLVHDNFLKGRIELKDGNKSKSQQRLTKDELDFSLKWRGSYAVCNSLEQILLLIDYDEERAIR